MLERVALHQVRLRVPGVDLDARGVAVGASGLALFPSLDRLLAFVAAYSRDRSLGPLAPLSVAVVRPPLGGSEVACVFQAGGSDRMDFAAGLVRSTGGRLFTGTQRHWVQYRDARAPFGWDVVELTPTEGDLVLCHETGIQGYRRERELSLGGLLLRVRPVAEHAGAPVVPLQRASGAPAATPLWVLCAPALGPRVAAHLALAGAQGAAALLGPSADDAPGAARWLLRLTALPPRLRALVATTPGSTAFHEVRPGVAVEVGFRHPVNLAACPVFPEDTLILIRAGGAPAVRVTPLPALVPLEALTVSGVEPGEHGAAALERHGAGGPPPSLDVPLRLLPGPRGGVPVAALVPAAELGLLRRLVYAWPARELQATRVVRLAEGALILAEGELSALPLGILYRALAPTLLCPLGFEVVPAVTARVLQAALGTPAGWLVFLRPGRAALAVDPAALVPLEQALLAPEDWVPGAGLPIAALERGAPEVEYGGVPLFGFTGLEGEE